MKRVCAVALMCLAMVMPIVAMEQGVLTDFPEGVLSAPTVVKPTVEIQETAPLVNSSPETRMAYDRTVDLLEAPPESKNPKNIVVYQSAETQQPLIVHRRSLLTDPVCKCLGKIAACGVFTLFTAAMVAGSTFAVVWFLNNPAGVN